MGEEYELTAFESALFSAVSELWQGYLLGEEVNLKKFVKEHSAELIEAVEPTMAEKTGKRIEDMALYQYPQPDIEAYGDLEYYERQCRTSANRRMGYVEGYNDAIKDFYGMIHKNNGGIGL